MGRQLPPPPLELCGGSMLQYRFDEFVAAASSASFQSISIWKQTYDRAKRHQDRSDADLVAMVADSGLRVRQVEGTCNWMPEGHESSRLGLSVDEGLALGDLFAADVLLAFCGAPANFPADGIVEAFAALCDKASIHGMIIGLEFLPWSAIGDVAAAWEVIRLAGRDNAGIVFDTWHHCRGADDDGLLEGVPPERVVSVQLADGWRRPTPGGLEEAMTERQVPGEGTLPLRRVVASLARLGVACPTGVEVYNETLASLPATKTARRLADATRGILSCVHEPDR